MLWKQAPLQIFNESSGECTTPAEFYRYWWVVRYISCLMLQIPAVPGNKQSQFCIFQIFLKATKFCMGAKLHFLSNGCRNEYNWSCKQAHRTDFEHGKYTDFTHEDPGPKIHARKKQSGVLLPSQGRNIDISPPWGFFHNFLTPIRAVDLLYVLSFSSFC